MRIFYLRALVFFHCSVCVCEQPYELWWQKCLGEEVSWQVFSDWQGHQNDLTRQCVRKYVRSKNYRSILDIPCGLCIDYWSLKSEMPQLEYLGIDITEKLVERAMDCGIQVLKGNIEDISLTDCSFDFCYARHIFEHLSYYEKAITELIRVAKREVMIVFSREPSNVIKDHIDLSLYQGWPLYHNTYNRSKLEKFILANPKTEEFSWEKVDSQNIILHVFLKSES